jgi:hypothetical protein
MGLFDFLKGKDTQTKEKSAGDAIKDVQNAAQASNYNQASLYAFYALEAIGKTYADLPRDHSQTVREYASLLMEDGRVTSEELEPILINFEISKYSPLEVTFEDYRRAEESLNNVYSKFKSGKPAKQSSARGKRGKKGSPKRRSTGSGAGQRARKRRKASK